MNCGYSSEGQTHESSVESVEEGLSLSCGTFWSNTMVSVFARQNPFDLMISEKMKVNTYNTNQATIEHSMYTRKGRSDRLRFCLVDYGT